MEPSGLLKSEEREGTMKGQRVFFEFVTLARGSGNSDKKRRPSML